MWQPLVAVLAVASVGAAEAQERTAAEQRLEERTGWMRDPDVLPVDDASPVEQSEVQGEFDFASRPETGEEGQVFSPRARLGLPWNLELGAGADVETRGAESSTAAASAHLLGQVLSERGALPALSLRGEVETPHGGAGLGAEARLLASKSIGAGQLHANVAYRARGDEADEYLLTAGADQPLGDTWLVQGGTYFLRSLGDSPEDTLGLDVGASLLMGERWVVSGVVGLNSREGDVAPRVVLGLMGKL